MFCAQKKPPQGPHGQWPAAASECCNPPRSTRHAAHRPARLSSNSGPCGGRVRRRHGQIPRKSILPITIAEGSGVPQSVKNRGFMRVAAVLQGRLNIASIPTASQFIASRHSNRLLKYPMRERNHSPHGFDFSDFLFAF